MSKKTYRVPVVWEMYGECLIEAHTIEEAIAIAYGPDTVLPEGEYIAGSFIVETELIRVHSE